MIESKGFMFTFKGALEGPQWGETIPVQLVQKELHPVGPLTETSPGPHRRETTRMPGEFMYYDSRVSKGIR